MNSIMVLTAYQFMFAAWLIAFHEKCCFATSSSLLFDYESHATLASGDDRFEYIEIGEPFSVFGQAVVRLQFDINAYLLGYDDSGSRRFMLTPLGRDYITTCTGTLRYSGLLSGSDLDEINAAFSLPAFAATWGFIATWIGVAEYGNNCEPIATFQLALATDGSTTVYIFNYIESPPYSEILIREFNGDGNIWTHEWSRSENSAYMQDISNVGLAGRFMMITENDMIVEFDGCTPTWMRCGDHGDCLDGECVCEQGYTGANCETEIDECASDPCANGATCMDSLDMYECTCGDGYTGSMCETEIDECASDPCMNNGTCVDFVDMYECTCVQNVTGTNCEFGPCETYETDFDGETFCENDGQCLNVIVMEGDVLVAVSECECPSGFSGAQCENEERDRNQGDASFFKENPGAIAAVTVGAAVVLGAGVVAAVFLAKKLGGKKKTTVEVIQVEPLNS